MTRSAHRPGTRGWDGQHVPAPGRGAHPFPLIRGGGLVVIGVGLGVLLGRRFPARGSPLASGGGVAGLGASGLGALRRPRLGAPAALPVGALVAAIALEVGLIDRVARRPRGASDRTRIRAIRLVVGARSVPLGLAPVANAAAGLGRFPQLPVRARGTADSLLKVGGGVWMLPRYPTLGLG